MFNTNQTLPPPLLSFYSATPSTTPGTFNNDEKSAFRLSIAKPKLVLSQRPMWRKENTFKNQWELRAKTTKQPKARKNTDDQVVIGFRVASDWLRKRYEFSGPITERGNAIPKQSQNSFDTLLKIALVVLRWLIGFSKRRPRSGGSYMNTIFGSIWIWECRFWGGTR